MEEFGTEAGAPETGPFVKHKVTSVRVSPPQRPRTPAEARSQWNP